MGQCIAPGAEEKSINMSVLPRQESIQNNSHNNEIEINCCKTSYIQSTLFLKNNIYHVLSYLEQNDLFQLRHVSKNLSKKSFWVLLANSHYRLFVSSTQLKCDNSNTIDPSISSITFTQCFVYENVFKRLIPYLGFTRNITIYDCRDQMNQSTPDTSIHFTNTCILSWKILTILKSCVTLNTLTLGSIGRASDLSNKSFRTILSRVGYQLTRLELYKIDVLSSEAFEIICCYCKKLTILTIFGCSNMKYFIKNKISFNHNFHLLNLLKYIGHQLLEIDIRYSVDIDDEIIRMLMHLKGKSLNSNGLKIFAASRERKWSSCLLQTSTLDSKSWAKFLHLYQDAEFLAVDDFTDDCNLFPVYVNIKPENLNRQASSALQLAANWPIAQPTLVSRKSIGCSNNFSCLYS